MFKHTLALALALSISSPVAAFQQDAELPTGLSGKMLVPSTDTSPFIKTAVGLVRKRYPKCKLDDVHTFTNGRITVVSTHVSECKASAYYSSFAFVFYDGKLADIVEASFIGNTAAGNYVVFTALRQASDGQYQQDYRYQSVNGELELRVTKPEKVEDE